LFEIALAAQVFAALAGHAVALAQGPKRTTASPAKSHPAARQATPKKAVPQGDGGAPTAAPASAAPVSGLSSDAGVVEAKTLDGGTRVFKFSELDIEGRLKSPQLVYFLRRVRAEFAAGDLGHRSFLREMSETRKESSF
jgi:hypothetical protein